MSGRAFGIEPGIPKLLEIRLVSPDAIMARPSLRVSRRRSNDVEETEKSRMHSVYGQHARGASVGDRCPGAFAPGVGHVSPRAAEKSGGKRRSRVMESCCQVGRAVIDGLSEMVMAVWSTMTAALPNILIMSGLAAFSWTGFAGSQGTTAGGIPGTGPATTNLIQSLSLSSARQLALERNWDLLAARADVDMATAQRWISKAVPNPTMALTLSKLPADR